MGLKYGVPPCLAILLAASSISASAYSDPKVSIQTISGDSGHAFVYAQVTDAKGTSIAPMGKQPTPYYAVWKVVPSDDSCRWLWLIPVYERATGRQINPARPGESGSYGVANHMCAKPGKTPVGTSRDQSARAILALDLRVWADPPVAPADKPVTIHGRLADRIKNDLTMALSMAIKSWEVASWHVIFGDGTDADFLGGTPKVEAAHRYARAGRFVASVTAHITGQAQASDYSDSGAPYLYSAPFSVDVTNRTDGDVRPNPVVRHIPPVLAAGAAPAVTAQPPRGAAFAHFEALRGRLTAVYPRVIVVQPGYMTRDDIRVGDAVTTLTRWEYLGGVNDAPAASATRPGAVGDATTPIWIQWNRPNPLVRGQPEDYVVPVRFYTRTIYPDNFSTEDGLEGSVTVTVHFTAISH